MTYCVAISVDAGLVFCSDSRTNAGVDQIRTYSKTYRFGVPGQRQLVVLSAGNLATTQAVIARLKKDIRDQSPVNLLTVESLEEAADYLGDINRNQLEKHTQHSDSSLFEASFILGGQIRGERPEVMLIYPEGNHITTSADTPYLQIGESKYGKPILDRILARYTALDTAALCSLVSMDSTMRSNLTVGPPIELTLYVRDSFESRHSRYDEGDDYLRELKRAWDMRLAEAFKQLPPIVWKTAHPAED